jgi:16S rRNA processing protein RimM
VQLKDCYTPEEARAFTNVSIGVFRDQLPPLPNNEYYWSDLEGLTVVNLQGIELGTVAYLFETGANDVIVVQGTKEHLIPYVPGPIIKNVDLNKRIEVDWDPDF